MPEGPLLRQALVEWWRRFAGSPHSRLRQRSALASLDDRLLKDIGLVRGREGYRPLSVTDKPVARLCIRDSVEADIAAVQRIYAHHVLNGSASFEEEPPSKQDLAARRDAVLARGLPYVVADLDGIVVGYSYASPYRARSAYRYTIEDSVYVAEGFHRLGIGRKLLSSLIARSEHGRWRQMLAVIGDSANTASINLHLDLGFEWIGVFRDVGWKFGRWTDTVLMQRPLGRAGSSPPE